MLVGVLFYALIAYMVVKTRHRWPLAARFSFLAALVDSRAFSSAWRCCGLFLQTRIFLPIYGTIYLLMIAMVIKSMPFGTQMIKSVLIQFGSDLEEASKVCGGTWLHTFRRVIFPLTMPALITVGLVGFISAARDISTVVLLGRESRARCRSDARLRRRRGVRKGHRGRCDYRRLGRRRGVFARALGGQVGVRE